MTRSPTPKQSEYLVSHILAIDPSIHCMGYAVINPSCCIEAIGVARQTTPTSVEYFVRSFAAARQSLFPHVRHSEMKQIDVVVEIPENWFGQRGQASKDDGAVQTLYLLVGCIIAMWTHCANCRGVWVVTPTRWKGNTPKDIMQKRAKAFAKEQGVYLTEKAPHDACEALLLAKYAVENYDRTLTNYRFLHSIWKRLNEQQEILVSDDPSFTVVDCIDSRRIS